MKDLKELGSHFSEIEDPRGDKGKIHKLEEIFIIAICAIICGADGFSGMEQFGRSKEEWFNSFLELEYGIPSQHTFRRVFCAIDSAQFKKCFIRWMKSISKLTDGEIVALDGKTVCNSHDKIEDKNPIHIVSAWANTNKLVLGQEKVTEKSNEITAIPKLLELLELEDCTITIDAMGCQKNIAKKIIDEGANYVLALKKNHENLYDDVEYFFKEERKNNFKDFKVASHKTVDKDHGRIEERKYFITSEIDWLANKEEWKQLKSIGMVESKRIVDGEETIERRFYLTCLEDDAKTFGKAVREHWGIENSLHWTLDVAFNEDNSRIRKKNGAENLAILRKLALNALKREDTISVGIKNKRLRAGWDNEYLKKVLSEL